MLCSVWDIGSLNDDIHKILDKWGVKVERFVIIVEQKDRKEPLIITDSYSYTGEVLANKYLQELVRRWLYGNWHEGTSL